MTVQYDQTLELISALSDLVNGEDVEATIDFLLNISMTDGVGKGNVDKAFFKKAESLAATASVTYDIAGGVNDHLGNTLTMAKLKLLYVRNQNTVAGDDLRVGNATSPLNIFNTPATTHTITADGALLLYQPSLTGICSITGGASDQLKLENLDATNAIKFDLLMLGTSS